DILDTTISQYGSICAGFQPPQDRARKPRKHRCPRECTSRRSAKACCLGTQGPSFVPLCLVRSRRVGKRIVRRVDLRLAPECAPCIELTILPLVFRIGTQTIAAYHCGGLVFKRNQNGIDSSSEGKGHTFESCWVRHRCAGMNCHLSLRKG